MDRHRRRTAAECRHQTGGTAEYRVYQEQIDRRFRMRLRETVATNLRRLRQAKNLSQEELADRAGINRNYVGMLEREQHAATIDMLEKLAIVLEADPVEFFRRDT